MEKRPPPTLIDRAMLRIAMGALWLVPVGALVACVGFYLNDNPTKAIFWLLVTVLVSRWADAARVRVRSLQTKAWHCEYCGELTTVPHRRCQEIKGPRPPLS